MYDRADSAWLPALVAAGLFVRIALEIGGGIPQSVTARGLMQINPPLPTVALHLPYVSRGGCLQPDRFDVIMLIDRSESMRRIFGADNESLGSWAISGAHWSMEGLDLTDGIVDTSDGMDGDRVAVLGFNASVWAAGNFTGNHYKAYRAASLYEKVAAGTRIDLALDAAGEIAAQELRKHPMRRQVIVVYSDRIPMGVPASADGSVETSIITAADRAKSGGATIAAIGYGDQDPAARALFDQITSTPGDSLWSDTNGASSEVVKRLPWRRSSCHAKSMR